MGQCEDEVHQPSRGKQIHQAKGSQGLEDCLKGQARRLNRQRPSFADRTGYMARPVKPPRQGTLFEVSLKNAILSMLRCLQLDHARGAGARSRQCRQGVYRMADYRILAIGRFETKNAPRNLAPLLYWWFELFFQNSQDFIINSKSRSGTRLGNNRRAT